MILPINSLVEFSIPLPVRVPDVVKWLHPKRYVWDKSENKQSVYLTFDDGPIPEVTPWVLDILATYKIKATFFCIGENIQKHPDLFKRILQEGHQVGNHTFNHLKGWKTDTPTYVENTLLAQKTIEQTLNAITNKGEAPISKLFRPPYGKIKTDQATALSSYGFEIIMYSVVAYDWDASVSREQCLNNITKHTRGGDLIVFHDSIKAFKNLKYALPKAIAFLQTEGYIFTTL